MSPILPLFFITITKLRKRIWYLITWPAYIFPYLFCESVYDAYTLLLHIQNDCKPDTIDSLILIKMHELTAVKSGWCFSLLMTNPSCINTFFRCKINGAAFNREQMNVIIQIFLLTATYYTVISSFN